MTNKSKLSAEVLNILAPCLPACAHESLVVTSFTYYTQRTGCEISSVLHAQACPTVMKHLPSSYACLRLTSVVMSASRLFETSSFLIANCRWQLLLVVMSCVAGQLKNLSSEVLYYINKVDRSTSTDSLGVVPYL